MLRELLGDSDLPDRSGFRMWDFITIKPVFIRRILGSFSKPTRWAIRISSTSMPMSGMIRLTTPTRRGSLAKRQPEVGCAPGAAVGALIDAAIFVGNAAAVAWVANEAINDGSRDAEAPSREEPKKAPPNPNGSRGSEEHQGKINERIQETKDQGHAHIAGGDKTEEAVNTPGGNKESRRPDITTRDPDGNPYRENVGSQNKDGTAVSRERKAQEEIQNATGQCAFTPYNCQ